MLSCAASASIATAIACFGAAGAADASNTLFVPPADVASQPAWLANLKSVRSVLEKQINYTGAVYSDAVVNWTRVSFVQPQAHMYDRYLYDSDAQMFTVDRFLDDVTRRYGGIDSILLWPTYTNIGIDARNQFDYFRSVPGGLRAVASLTADFKARGVRVLWAYNPWDQSTRDEGEPHWETMVRLLKLTHGDGFNGDTMTTMYKEFWIAGVAADYRIVGEMEGGGYPAGGGRPDDGSWASAEWSPMGWGYFDRGAKSHDNITYAYDVAPGVDRFKWLDGRHMTHVCDRWAKNRTDALQYAFFNGVGYESWENVWGIFMHFTERDGEALRRVATLLRWLGRRQYVQGFADWEPYTPELRRPSGLAYSAGGPVASRFVHENGDCAWLVVNRAGAPAMAELDTSRCGEGLPRRLFDLYRGVELTGGSVARISLEPNGYGALLVALGKPAGLPLLLETMANITRLPLESYSADWQPLQQEMVFHSSPRRVRMTPPGMALIPKTLYLFRSAGVEIEGGCDAARDAWGVCCPAEARSCPHDAACATPCASLGEDSRGVDVQFPWEPAPGRFHERLLELGPLFVDRHLVTKADYAAYLNATGYRPLDPHNFLADWEAGGGGPRPAFGEGLRPVVWVSLREARAYCAWAGKRLPHAYEWQLAAQGTDGRLYPWGNTDDGARRPAASRGRVVPPLPDVGAFSPLGDSPYGVADLVGYVWQYTDEFRDEHTRTVLLKGSSAFEPMVSSAFPALPQVGNWYFPKALQVNRHNRMMLMDDSYERAGTLGFRCVADHSDGLLGPLHARDAGAAQAEEVVYV